MRGKESEKFAEDFKVQKKGEGNPPAFLLALNAINEKLKD